MLFSPGLTHPDTQGLPITSALETEAVVGAEALQQLSGLLRNMVHEGLAVALHVAFGLLKRQLADVPKCFLVILCRGIGQNE